MSASESASSSSAGHAPASVSAGAGSPTSASLPPAPPGIVFRLGAVAGERAPEHEVATVVGEHADSFSLEPGMGYFRGEADPGWVITLARDDPSLVADLAEALRARFTQESVAVLAFGRYLRCRADHGPVELAAELRALAARP